MQMPKKRGKVIVPDGVKPWKHELHTAAVLKAAGHTVKFMQKGPTHTADIIVDRNIECEMKAPLTDRPKMVMKNVKRALKQSPNVIIDSARIKQLDDEEVEKILRTVAKTQKRLKRLIFINKKQEVVDIKGHL